MKYVMVILIFCSTAFAAEVSTDCPAMNGSREKIVKDVTIRKGKAAGSQVVSQ